MHGNGEEVVGNSIYSHYLFQWTAAAKLGPSMKTTLGVIVGEIEELSARERNTSVFGTIESKVKN